MKSTVKDCLTVASKSRAIGMDKRIVIIAGPNGAGKTTFARDFLPQEARCPRFINADLIAAGLSPFAPELESVKAGRLMLAEMTRCVQRGESFAFETTLAGLGYRQRIDSWRALGYRIHLYFLQLPEVETAIDRVAERVRQGGHDIPEPVIRRRFVAGWRNFNEHYKQRVNAWALYDNAGSEPHLIDWGENP
jgi:predicted ABC-type ATPase